MAERILRYKF